MDYKNQYNKLISRAQHRKLAGYLENHHILPKCMGGTNHKNNLVKLTSREHFIAHILLVKIYPKEYKLIFAVNAMCRFKENRDCSKNRMYGWLRKKHAKTISKINSFSQLGRKNSQYGTCWITNIESGISKKIENESLNTYTNIGWIKGRNKKKIKCKNCDILFFPKANEKRCKKECKKTRKSFLTGRENELIELYKKYNSLNKALKEMGYSAKGDYFYKAKKILKI